MCHQVEKTVILFHDESTFQANDDQKTFWGTKDMVFLRPKRKGAGLMVSDFIDEHNGYLRLTDKQFEQGKKGSPWFETPSNNHFGVRGKQRTVLDIGQIYDTK